MSEKKVHFDKERQWQVEEIGASYIGGTDTTMVMLQVLGGYYIYYVTVPIFESDRFEEVEG